MLFFIIWLYSESPQIHDFILVNIVKCFLSLSLTCHVTGYDQFCQVTMTSHDRWPFMTGDRSWQMTGHDRWPVMTGDQSWQVTSHDMLPWLVITGDPDWSKDDRSWQVTGLFSLPLLWRIYGRFCPSFLLFCYRNNGKMSNWIAPYLFRIFWGNNNIFVDSSTELLREI